MILELLQALSGRRSVRHFTAEAISDEQLDALVEAAGSAPSGGNTQPWALAVVREPGNVKRMRAAAPGISGIPTAFIVICLARVQSYQEQGRGYETALLSLGAAMQNLLLSAHEQGLGACAIGSFHVPSVRSILLLPEHLQPKLLVALGYPARQPESPGRRSLREIRFFEQVGTK